MCGRYTLTVTKEAALERFDLDVAEVEIAPRYNIAPTQKVAVVYDESPRTLSQARWGLVPSWSKTGPSAGQPLINARVETLLEKPSFRNIFRARRCFVLCDGFYEWQRNPDGTTIPYRATLADGAPFALAGLWDEWTSPEGEVIRSCTVITTEANDLLAPLHHRMAVILRREIEKQWLGKGKPEELMGLLTAYPASDMRVYPVSKAVNTVKRDDAELIAEVEPPIRQAALF